MDGQREAIGTPHTYNSEKILFKSRSKASNRGAAAPQSQSNCKRGEGSNCGDVSSLVVNAPVMQAAATGLTPGGQCVDSASCSGSSPATLVLSAPRGSGDADDESSDFLLDLLLRCDPPAAQYSCLVACRALCVTHPSVSPSYIFSGRHGPVRKQRTTHFAGTSRLGCEHAMDLMPFVFCFLKQTVKKASNHSSNGTSRVIHWILGTFFRICSISSKTLRRAKTDASCRRVTRHAIT
jgi:hypothetical protein